MDFRRPGGLKSSLGRLRRSWWTSERPKWTLEWSWWTKEVQVDFDAVFGGLQSGSGGLWNGLSGLQSILVRSWDARGGLQTSRWTYEQFGWTLEVLVDFGAAQVDQVYSGVVLIDIRDPGELRCRF